MNGGREEGVFFLDTNLFVYAHTDSDPGKQSIAISLIEKALLTRQGMISTQVVQEFLNLATRRAMPAFSPAEMQEYLNKVLWPLCHHFPSKPFYDLALQIRHETGYSFYDALIIAAAEETGCHRLLTEDLQYGRVVRGVRIVNPFAQ